jgi:hypothetical protein
MAHDRYSMPTAKERRLLLQLEASEERCVSLLADSTGASAIASLDARIAGLTTELAEKDKTIDSLKA